MRIWGTHLLLTARKCHPLSIRCIRTIEAFSNNLVKKIDMVPYGPPQIAYFGEDDKKGFTLVQLIQTSNITAHFVEQYDEIHLDVFSCKDFNPVTVESEVRRHFYAEEITSQVIKR